jgi:hypothetical protein
MKRRVFLVGVSATTAAAAAGCLGGDTPVGGPDTDAEHTDALRSEIDDRGVEVTVVEVAEDVVEVEHRGAEGRNDAIANVAMAFVDRIAEGWDVGRLEGLLRGDGTEWTWHAEAEWARSYADGDSGPEEYGSRLSETLAVAEE